jgi:hypothetical protein
MPGDEAGERLGGRDPRLALCGDGAGIAGRRVCCDSGWRRGEGGDRGRHQRHVARPMANAIDRGTGGGLIVPTPRLDYRFAISL